MKKKVDAKKKKQSFIVHIKYREGYELKPNSPT